MSTINYMRIAQTGVDMSTARKPRPKIFKKASLESQTRERVASKVDSRSNMCRIHNIARSLNGVCDDC